MGLDTPAHHRDIQAIPQTWVELGIASSVAGVVVSVSSAHLAAAIHALHVISRTARGRGTSLLVHYDVTVHNGDLPTATVSDLVQMLPNGRGSRQLGNSAQM